MISFMNMIWLQAAPTAFLKIGWKFYLAFIIPGTIGGVAMWIWWPDTNGLPHKFCSIFVSFSFWVLRFLAFGLGIRFDAWVNGKRCRWRLWIWDDDVRILFRHLSGMAEFPWDIKILLLSPFQLQFNLFLCRIVSHSFLPLPDKESAGAQSIKSYADSLNP